MQYLCNRKIARELSSVGLERLPYKQRVGGSTPSAPTKKTTAGRLPFFFLRRIGTIMKQYGRKLFCEKHYLCSILNKRQY